MKRIIPYKNKDEDIGQIMLKFRRRRKKNTTGEENQENEEQPDVIIHSSKNKKQPDVTAIDELLEYLYENLTELFIITGETKDRVMLERESVLKVVDNIPDELLEKCNIPPEKEKADIELQTLLIMD